MPQEQENWKDIHPDFEIYASSFKTYQEEWKEKGLNYQEAQEWIKVGFKPHEYHLVFQLKNNGFTPPQYINFTNKDAQEWVNHFYPIEKRSQVTNLKIYNKGLSGTLKLEGFSNLKELDLSWNNLDELKIVNCSQISSLGCSFNQLVTLDFLTDLDPSKLTKLYLGSNKFNSQNLSRFSPFTNLEELDVGENKFFGSLKPLVNFSRIKKLNIDETEIDCNLEYLHKIRIVILFELEKQIIQELKPYQEGVVRKNYPTEHNLQKWRTGQHCYQLLKKFLLKINSNLNIQEIIDKFEFFNVKTGEFQGDLNNLLFLFNFNQEETYFLKKTIETLNKELKKYKEKIVKAYCSFAPEKELLQELINAELEYRKAKEQKQPSRKLEKQLNELKDKLEEKIGEEQMEEVEIILTDCNNLVRTELELENKINCNKLIEDFRKEFTNLNITINHHGDIVASERAIVVSGAIVSESLNIQSQNRLIELPEQEFQPQIEIPPK